LRFTVARLLRYGAIAMLPALLLMSPAAANAADPPNLHEGSSGRWVRVAQQDLTDLGYSLPVTGTFGAHTRAEVNAFKKAHQLPQDGQLDWPRSWKALRAATRREQSIPEHFAHLNSRGLAVAPRNAARAGGRAS
jgi:peptidoglycan hydrolase-like protein with peptidoglycan-binding domain